MDMDPKDCLPRCIATTGAIYQTSITTALSREAIALGQSAPLHSPPPHDSDPTRTEDESDYFKSAEWSADGTCLLTSSEDRRLRTFVL